MQAKISAYFKSSALAASESPELNDDTDLRSARGKSQEILVTYTRRNSNTGLNRNDQDDSQECCPNLGKTAYICQTDLLAKSAKAPEKSCSSTRVLNKKRNYAQYHLELGQSDFSLHSCFTCGLKYACGDQTDEMVHNTFHKNYYLGIRCKGWFNERVISSPVSGGGRIILVLPTDPPFQRRKVEDVIRIMKRDLDLQCAWLFFESCKVYLFISSKRIIGCLVAEPIRTAHKVLSSSDEIDTNSSKLKLSGSANTSNKQCVSSSNMLPFGCIRFQREIARQNPKRNDREITKRNDHGAIRCSKEAVPAVCGVRAIWVAPSCRRQKIASQLMDALRKNFCRGFVLEPFHCAFSQPTAAGRAFASSYCNTNSFLVYYTAGNSQGGVCSGQQEGKLCQ